MITKAYPTPVPVPDGYRMLQIGEQIKENDQLWNGTAFEDVPKIATYASLYSLDHGCIIRASLDHRQPSQTAKDEQRADIIKTDYYQTESVYEPFKIIRHFNLNFFEGNVLKYLLRAGKKNSATRLEDLRKANTYLASEIEQTKKEGKAK